MMFENRREAGRQLAIELAKYKDRNPVILAVPRGGVPVGYEVASALNAPLDVIIARKLGAPFSPELAIGAVVDGDSPQTVLNQDIIDKFGISQEYLETEVDRVLKVIARRQETYRKGRQPVSVDGATVIVVDDGIATGASMRAAIRGIRRKPIGRVILAVPVAPASAINSFQREVDEVVCLHAPEHFGAVGAFYSDFGQTTDDEVIALLEAAQDWSNEHATR